MLAALILLVACGTAPAPDPADAVGDAPAQVLSDPLTGVVLFASPSSLVVQQDEVAGRTVPGLAIYRVPAADLTADLQPGDTIRLRTREGDGVLQLAQVTETGTGPIPPSAAPHPLTGTVVNTETGRITVDHDPVDGVMGAMVMGFQAATDDAARVRTGDRISATLVGSRLGFAIVDLKIVGEADAALRTDIAPLLTGEIFPRTEIPTEDGSPVVVGAGADKRTALTFLYTTCPDPQFCPLLATRLQALQQQIGTEARIVAVTIDPEIDQPRVLQRYAQGVGADPAIWRFGRLEPEWLQQVALRAGMIVTIENGRIAHLSRLLVLDADGTLIERYDDNDWDLERVATQLKTGAPRAPAGQGGTRSTKEGSR